MDDVAAWRKTKRAELWAARVAVGSADRARWSEAINESLRSLLETRPAGLIGFYWPFRGEVDLRPTVQALIDRGWHAALPVVVAKAEPLIYRAWTPETKMERGALGILAPADGATVLPDVVLAPLVGFDAARYRLGNGGGYFDITLAAMKPRPLAIGVGFELLRLDTIHLLPHDQPMDAIITEAGVFR